MTGICKECSRPAKGQGYCKSHHAMKMRRGELPRLRPHKRLGLSGHPMYSIWWAMMQRCYRANCRNYGRYGGRGILVDASWHDVRQFIADMSPRPNGGILDRIDNDSGYCKENCRWTDAKTSSMNRRRDYGPRAHETMRRRGVGPYKKQHCLAIWQLQHGG